MSHILAQKKTGVEVKSIIVKVAIAITGLILLLWLLDESVPEETDADQQAIQRTVTVIAVEPSAVAPEVVQTGLVKSRWMIDVISTVSGKTKQHFDTILPGSVVETGQALALVDDTVYQAEVALEKSRIDQAALNLARYQHEQTVAKKIENGGASNDFRLFIPHVAAAKSELQAAKASHASAQKRLNETTITAPFNAVVLSKYVVPEKQINVGDILYQLASSDAVDIEVFLSLEQWRRVNPTLSSSAVIQDSSGSEWLAKVRFLSAHLDTQTRQRSIQLTIDSPYENGIGLLPDQQVSVTFAGQTQDHVVQLPATSLTRDNHVWVVENDMLVQEQITLISEGDKVILATFKQSPEKARAVVEFPLSTMIEGKKVKGEFRIKEEL